MESWVLHPGHLCTFEKQHSTPRSTSVPQQHGQGCRDHPTHFLQKKWSPEAEWLGQRLVSHRLSTFSQLHGIPQ